jgi:hypothetical protein
MTTNATEARIGTSCSFSVVPLRTTISGTTPIATSPTARTRIGTVNPAISPGSRSGSCRRIEVISARITERALRNDSRGGTARI